MSESKARIIRHAEFLAAECDKLEAQVVYLLQGMLDIASQYPDVTLPDLGGDRFSKRIWKRVLG